MHAGTPIEAFGGATHGATKRCTGLGGRMRAPPLWPSVELPTRSRSAVLVVADSCGHPPLGPA
eukprot:8459692-Pyramimonas_sp.AAC.1